MESQKKYTKEALLQAVEAKDTEQVRDILIHEPMLADASRNHVPAAMLAAAGGSLELVRYMVEYSRANMNIVDDRNRNMLHYGTMSGKLEVVRYLTEKVGFSPLTGDFDLITPLEMAADEQCMGGRYNNREIKAYFEDYVGCAYAQMYKNPIRRGMYPDPSIVRVGEDYYMANSSFIYFPCIPISHSKDLVNWEIIGHAITNPQWAGLDELEGGRGYWAPDISWHNGEFYVTATYRLNDGGEVYRRQIVVHSPTPEGPYSKPVFVDEDGIDPSLFWEDDGRCYMLLNRGARILELDTKTWRPLSQARLLYYGSQKRASEGPHLLKKDGWYYLFEAEGGTGIGHRETVSRARTLMGNYEPCPYNPILRQEDEGAPIQRCGHAKPVQTPEGDWYMVYLCGRRIVDEEGFGMSILGRETCLDKITWTPDGWPLVNGRQGPSALAPLPYPNRPQKKISDIRDDFSGKKLGLHWSFPRPPQKDGFRLEGGKLYLKASPAPLSSVRARNLLLCRQDSFRYEACARLDVSALKEAQETGMTCYYDENTWLSFGFKNGALWVWEHIGEKEIAYPSVQLLQKPLLLTLKVSTDYLERTFSYSLDGTEFIEVLRLPEVKYLCDEGVKMGKRFTGAMTGLYAYGESADFYGIFEEFTQRAL